MEVLTPDVRVREGESIRLECRAVTSASVNPYRIIWSKDGESLDPVRLVLSPYHHPFFSNKQTDRHIDIVL